MAKLDVTADIAARVSLILNFTSDGCVGFIWEERFDLEGIKLDYLRSVESIVFDLFLVDVREGLDHF